MTVNKICQPLFKDFHVEKWKELMEFVMVKELLTRRASYTLYAADGGRMPGYFF